VSHCVAPPDLSDSAAFLHRLERSELGARALTLAAGRFEPLLRRELLGTQRLHLLECGAQSFGKLLASRASKRFLLRERCKLLGGFLCGEGIAL